MPRVSVLIPVRERDAAYLLPALERLEYANLEIVLIGENTAALVDFAAGQNGRVVVLDGGELPAGWWERAWYADQLAAAASGEILIFADSAARLSPRAVARTVHAIEKSGVVALSALPREQVVSWNERALIPFRAQLAVAGLIPLRRWLSGTSKGAPVLMDGTWFAVRRENYFAVGGHGELTGSALPARDLARALAGQGKVAAVVAAEDISLRRYQGPDALWEGLSKGFHAALDGNPAWLAAAIAVDLVAFVAPWVAAVTFRSGGFYALCLLVAFRIASARLFGAPAVDVIHHPAGSLVLPGVLLDGFWRESKSARDARPGSLRLTTLDSQASAP